MPKVTFLPMNTVCEAKAGESILDVAIQNDVPLQHACGGFCACTTCHVIVVEGAQNLAPMEEAEEERIEHADGVGLQSRLGCQAQVRGDVTVQVVNQGY